MIIKVSMIGIAAVILSILLKDINTTFGVAAGIAASLLISLIAMDKLKIIVGYINMIESMIGDEKEYLRIIIKLTGISYIARFAVAFCNEAGQVNVGMSIEFAAKLIILAQSLPLFLSLIKSIERFLVI